MPLLNKTNLLTLGFEGLKEFVAGLGMAGYRAGQVARWIYSEGLESFDGMTNISKADRGILNDNACIEYIRLMGRQVSQDKTEKFLFGLHDGEMVESVLIPEEDRLTLCVSSQAGCALGCRFCLTGAGGYRRDLLPHEITGQVLLARKMARPGVLTNLVLMGMGEPLLNAGNVFEALSRLTDPRMFSISTRRITLSTAGVVPGIKKLGESGLGVNLAVSINAADDATRDMLMPINRKYPLRDLMRALKDFPLAPRRRITIEYVLLKGVNDSVSDAARLAVLLRGLRCKVNLIPFNEHEGSTFRRPDEGAVLRFQQTLAARHYTAFIRESRGTDILAACGQLRADREIA
jgi:23S rRNA (adenine2503-C2)-methyltransferase